MSVVRVTIMPGLAAALLNSSIACGSQGSPTKPGSLVQPGPASPPAPTPQSETGVVPASNGGVPGVFRRDVVVALTGAVTVSLSWPDGDYSLQLYVTSGACADTTSLLGGGCIVTGRTRPGDLPGMVKSPVTSGDLITIWVLNTDHAPQSFTVGMAIE